MKVPEKRGHKAKRSLGQNFLYDETYIEKIIKAVDAGPGQAVIEIGPGRGALTSGLARSGAEVIALELDRRLIAPLRVLFHSAPNVRVVEQDALTADFRAILFESASPGSSSTSVKLAANLPYNISTAILQSLAGQRELFSELVLMFQREVADRISARPGNSDRGFLTVLAESAFTIERLFDVPPQAFRPVPKVWSSVVRLIPKPKIPAEEGLRNLLSVGFAQKRKTIANNLKGVYPNYLESLDKAGIEPINRAEALSLEDWLRLNGAIARPRVG